MVTNYWIHEGELNTSHMQIHQILMLLSLEGTLCWRVEVIAHKDIVISCRQL